MAAREEQIVVVGGGFAGLYAAKILGRNGFQVTVIDRNNYHLFQPLLYQVATGFLSPGAIAAPLRSILAKFKSVRVIQDEVTDIDTCNKIVELSDGELKYDKCIVATGVTHSYFGNDIWETSAPGLKTVENALEIREQVLSVFERAERSSCPDERKNLLRFAIVGGGPTGVELAGALGELKKNTLKGEFRNFDPEDSEIVLIEGGDRVLNNFRTETSDYTTHELKKLGVDVLTNTLVTNISRNKLTIKAEGNSSVIDVGTILWAAGVKASPLASSLTRAKGESTDRLGRVQVSKELTLQNDSDVFVVGDLAAVMTEDGKEVPGVAPAAIQQGEYVARSIIARARGAQVKPFRYFDKGNMAVIGRGRAVAETWKFRLWGLPGWLAWAFVHIYFLIEFQNKLIVFMQWAWNYFTDKRGTRLLSASPRSKK